MNRINIILVCLVSLSCVFASGLKKLPSSSSFSPIERLSKTESVNENGQKLSISLGYLLGTNGDLSSDYQSGMSVDFLVNCNKSCSVLGQKLNLGLGFGFTPMCNDDENIKKLSIGSVAVHVMPDFNLPLKFNFGAGLGHAPGSMGVGLTTLISMDVFYKLPFCNNMSIGFQYRNLIDPEDGGLNFSKLGSYGFGLRFDG